MNVFPFQLSTLTFPLLKKRQTRGKMACLFFRLLLFRYGRPGRFQPDPSAGRLVRGETPSGGAARRAFFKGSTCL